MNRVEVRQYQTADGRIPIAEWIATLRDRQTVKVITARLTRLQAGHRGDWKAVGAGVFELRMTPGRAIACIAGRTAERWCCCCAVATSEPKQETSSVHTTTGKTTKAAASVPFRAADYLQPDDIPGYLAEVTAGGDTRALPIALRDAADVLGMAKLAHRTGLNRETLYRTLSENGNPRLDTLTTILEAFGLRLAVQAKDKPHDARASAGREKVRNRA